MRLNRRKVLVGAGAAVFGAASVGAGQSVLADGHDIPVEIAEVNPVEETVILENTGSETIDLESYQLDWEHENDRDQTDTFEESVTIEPGEQLSVWSGFQSTQIEDVEADYQIAEYGNGRINDDESDVIALLSPSGEVVARSDDEYDASSISDEDSGSGSDSDENTSDSSAETEDESGESGEDTDSDDTESDSGADDGDETAEEGEEVDATTDEDDDCPEEDGAETEAEDDDCPEEEEAKAEAEVEDDDCPEE